MNENCDAFCFKSVHVKPRKQHHSTKPSKLSLFVWSRPVFRMKRSAAPHKLTSSKSSITSYFSASSVPKASSNVTPGKLINDEDMESALMGLLEANEPQKTQIKKRQAQTVIQPPSLAKKPVCRFISRSIASIFDS